MLCDDAIIAAALDTTRFAVKWSRSKQRTLSFVCYVPSIIHHSHSPSPLRLLITLLTIVSLP
jgi:hypothetical protein